MPCKYNGHWKHWSFIASQIKIGTFETSKHLKNDPWDRILSFSNLLSPASTQLCFTQTDYEKPQLHLINTESIYFTYITTVMFHKTFSKKKHKVCLFVICVIHIVNHPRGCWGKKFPLGVKLYQTAVSVFLAVQWASEQMLRFAFFVWKFMAGEHLSCFSQLIIHHYAPSVMCQPFKQEQISFVKP